MTPTATARRLTHVPAGRRLAVCADIGSTFTKALAVDTATGALAATAAGPTTIDTDVLDGLDACQAALADTVPHARWTDPLVCSSAGGGLRLAVVGYQALVSAQAGHAVGLSAGARVVHVAAGRLDEAGVAAVADATPDVILLVGGTDGGDADVLTHNAARLAAAGPPVPVVVAGNAHAAEAVTGLLTNAGVAAYPTDNVLPRIGVIAPDAARAAIRRVFLSHVIGGKQLSAGDRLPTLVRGATPEIILTAVEALADGGDTGDLLVVDVGGATTDVYSVLTPDAERAGPRRDVAGWLWRCRTVEADLGMRWNAPGIVAAARAEKLLTTEQADRLAGPATTRAEHPDWLPATPADTDDDTRLARLAVTIALRRHARGARRADGSRAPARDLRQVRLVIGSGGVLRHANPAAATHVLRGALDDHAGGYPLPTAATHTVDTRYVLAAVGLLAGHDPHAAIRLGTRHLSAPATDSAGTG